MTVYNLLLLILIVPFSLFGQPVPKQTLQKILVAQDLRDAQTLQRFLRDPLPTVRARAALAAGSVQDVSTIPKLCSLLVDVNRGVRQAAAFALGQTNFVADSVQRRTISGALAARLGFEEDKLVLLRLIEALGKIGDMPSLEELTQQADKISSASLRGEIALAIGRYAYRGVKSQGATAAAATELEKGSKNEKWKAAYALFRIGDSDLLGSHTRQIVAAASDVDPNVRMYAATALGKITTTPSNLDLLVKLAEADFDSRVRVNAVKALASLDLSASARQTDALVKAFDDPDEHVSLAALAAVGVKERKDLEMDHPVVSSLQRILSGESDRYSLRQQREAAIAYSRLQGIRSCDALSHQAEDGRIQMNTYIEALAYIPSETALRTLMKYSWRTEPSTQRIAFESLLNVTKLVKPVGLLLDSARSCFIRGLVSSDMAVIATAASALAESLLADSASVQDLIAALRRLESTGNIEPMTAIIQSLGALKAESATSMLTHLLESHDFAVAKEAAAALEAISGISYKHKLVQPAKPEHTNFDWALLDWVRKHPSVDVKTIRGSFTIQMLPDEAPFTCISFAELIRKGFFTGLTFHRVVPNFVIQGGDPHGDGWGGPGYAIRSEFGFEHYDRGTVGVASSGKDTEGSQFFVTHSSQPHLDGRYTIFGKVTSGMDIVDAIEVGDKIEQMSFSSAGETDRDR